MGRFMIFDRDSGSKLNSILTAIANPVTILVPLIGLGLYFWTGSADIPATILAIYVCILPTILFAILIVQIREHHRETLIQEIRHNRENAIRETKYRREARYAGAMVPARKAFSALADASWGLIEGDGSEESFIYRLKESLGYLAEAFTLIIDQPCRVSVKMISTDAPKAGQTPDKQDVQVVTLCRSSDVSEDVPERVQEGRDLIGNNTDFKKIFVENSLYFFCNDLPAQLSQGYQNSHWNEHVIRSKGFDYQSTIVWPIGRSRFLKDQKVQEREIIGFLCVDSLAVNIFNETYDVPLGQAFSQALHLALHRFRAGRSPLDN